MLRFKTFKSSVLFLALLLVKFKPSDRYNELNDGAEMFKLFKLSVLFSALTLVKDKPSNTSSELDDDLEIFKPFKSARFCFDNTELNLAVSMDVGFSPVTRLADAADDAFCIAFSSVSLVILAS